MSEEQGKVFHVGGERCAKCGSELDDRYEITDVAGTGQPPYLMVHLCRDCYRGYDVAWRKN